MVVVPKPNGKIRICVDLSRLNDSVKRKNFPLPRIDKSLALTKKKALWLSQWRPCGKFAAALPQTHCKVAAVCFYHANEPSCRFAINLPQPCGKIIYVNYPLAKLRHSVTLHICFLAMLWHTNQFINIHWNLLANLRHALP